MLLPLLINLAMFDQPDTGGGGGVKSSSGKLPQYYSRRVLNERITLPQDAESNRVAIAVLDDAKDLEKRLAKDDRDFNEMLEQIDHMLKQVAVYVESQQIYNVVRTIQQRVQARLDAELSEELRPIQEAMDDEEFNELVQLI